jgi:hypothetical protein
LSCLDIPIEFLQFANLAEQNRPLRGNEVIVWPRIAPYWAATGLTWFAEF